MKKMFTLLFSIGLMTAAVAQNNNRDNNRDEQWNNNRNDNQIARNDNRYGNDDRYRNSRYEMERKRDMEIARINRDYDYQVQKLRNNFFMNRYEKQRRIRMLDEKREREIRRVYAQYGNNRRYNDQYDQNERRHH